MYPNSSERTEHSHDALSYDILAVEREKYRTGMPLLTEIEQHQLEAWNAARQDYPRDACIPQLVALQAATTPDATALVAGHQILNYRRLNQRANQLAHYLQKLGVGPNVFVGLCIERSLDLVVGLLGILKAGGAYVPLDPGYPPERLTFMLEDAQTLILVTQQHLVNRFTANGIQLVCLDADTRVLAQQSTSDPTSLSKITDLAYIIYTSGSTGYPKGALITHDGLLNLIFWHQRAFEVTSSDRATPYHAPRLARQQGNHDYFPANRARRKYYVPGVALDDCIALPAHRGRQTPALSTSQPAFRLDQQLWAHRDNGRQHVWAYPSERAR